MLFPQMNEVAKFVLEEFCDSWIMRFLMIYIPKIRKIELHNCFANGLNRRGVLNMQEELLPG